MLYISLVLSTFLLAIANVTVRHGYEPGREPQRKSSVLPLVGCALFGPLALLFLGVAFPVLVLQAFLLIVVAAIWSSQNWSARRFAVLAGAVTLLAYAIVGTVVAYDVAQLRQEFPYVSMEERLPQAPEPHQGVSIERLDRLEAMFADAYPHGWSDTMRVEHLRQLHEDTVRVFANRPGFGIARTFQVSSTRLRRGLRDAAPLPQPGDRITVLWSTGDLETPAAPSPSSDYESSWRLHAAGLVDFAHPRGFGYLRDRGHVAGFQGHQFSRPPEPPAEWTLRTIDLIGLVRHDRPVAYVSDHLPAMEELRSAPWRPLDDFENRGLESFRRGEDLFIRNGSGGRRLLGAIRNTQQCVDCHGGGRGDLLGAFSYTLTPLR